MDPWALKRAKSDVHVQVSLTCAVITPAAQTLLCARSALRLHSATFAYAATIIVVYHNYRCIVSALKISVFL